MAHPSSELLSRIRTRCRFCWFTDPLVNCSRRWRIAKLLTKCISPGCVLISSWVARAMASTKSSASFWESLIWGRCSDRGWVALPRRGTRPKFIMMRESSWKMIGRHWKCGLHYNDWSVISETSKYIIIWSDLQCERPIRFGQCANDFGALGCENVVDVVGGSNNAATSTCCSGPGQPRSNVTRFLSMERLSNRND